MSLAGTQGETYGANMTRDNDLEGKLPMEIRGTQLGNALIQTRGHQRMKYQLQQSTRLDRLAIVDRGQQTPLRTLAASDK